MQALNCNIAKKDEAHCKSPFYSLTEKWPPRTLDVLPKAARAPASLLAKGQSPVRRWLTFLCCDTAANSYSLWQTGHVATYSFINLGDLCAVAFRRGFWKGMAAPIMLFSSVELPAAAQPVKFMRIERMPTQSENDWVQVGNALRLAAEKVRAEGG